MSYTNYLKIKDKVCICSEGHNPEYLIQLRILLPTLTKEFPEIDFTFACRAENVHYIRGAIPMEIYNQTKGDYAFSYEIIYDAHFKEHPIVSMLNNSNITPIKIKSSSPRGHIAYISAIGDFPNSNLTDQQIKKACSFAANKGFKTKIIQDKLTLNEIQRMVIGAAFVIGTSNELFYEAVAAEAPTALIPTGPQAEDIYRMLVQSPNVLP
jgi:hypothetical protein